jgi:hypothetical protein
VIADLPGIDEGDAVILSPRRVLILRGEHDQQGEMRHRTAAERFQNRSINPTSVESLNWIYAVASRRSSPNGV